MTKRNRLIYILSPSYSGSTLLTFLLARHPEISTIGELKAPHIDTTQTYLCSCGADILECEFWQALTEECRRRGIDFDVSNFATQIRGSTRLRDRLFAAAYRGTLFETLRAAGIALIPGVRRELDALLRRNFELSQAICRIQGGPVFLDGSKTAIRLRHYIDSHLWDLRVIHLTRDGRGVVGSNMSNLGLDFDTALGRWQHAAAEILRVRARVPRDRLIDVRYEDLCRDPKRELGRITALAGLEDLDFDGKRFDKEDCHILGNSMRLSNVTEIRLDEKWRRRLSETELDRFAESGSALNGRLGYA